MAATTTSFQASAYLQQYTTVDTPELGACAALALLKGEAAQKAARRLAPA